MEILAEGASARPFWSSGGDFIAFRQDDELVKIPAEGGQVLRICQLPQPTSPNFYGGTWSLDDDEIVFSYRGAPILYVVPSGGGEPRPLFTDDELRAIAREIPGEASPVAVSPRFVSAGTESELLIFRLGFGGPFSLVVADLGNEKVEILHQRGSSPGYSSGHIVYWLAQDVWALPFSIDALQATGEPFLVAQNAVGPTVSNDGTLVYSDAIVKSRQLVWLDREGNQKGVVGKPHAGLETPRLSPDGQKILFIAETDLWVYEQSRNLERRLSSLPDREYRPAWSPSGEEVAFSSNMRGDQDIYTKRTDGAGEAEMVLGGEVREVVNDWSPNGQYILYRTIGQGEPANLWYLKRAENGSEWEPTPFLQSPAATTQGTFAPEGQFVAYVSNKTGGREVYVRSFPGGEGPRQVSTNGGNWPRWSRDGSELFYVEGNSLVAVPVSTKPNFTSGVPRQLFPRSGLENGFDVSMDGKQFIVVTPVGEAPEPAIRVVQNWYEEFRDREQD